MRAASSAGSTTPSRVRSSLPLAKKCVVGYVSKAWDFLISRHRPGTCILALPTLMSGNLAAVSSRIGS